MSDATKTPFSEGAQINDTESPAKTLPLSAHPCVEVSVGVTSCLVDGWADNGVVSQKRFKDKQSVLSTLL